MSDLTCCECDRELAPGGCPNRECCEWQGLSVEHPPEKYYCDDMRHLVCVPYSRENLHMMAEDLGIKRCWFHNGGGGRFPHYDVPKRRVSEIQARCVVVSAVEILAICKGERG